MFVPCHLLLPALYSSSLRPSYLLLLVKVSTQLMSLSPYSLLGSSHMPHIFFGGSTNVLVIALVSHDSTFSAHLLFFEYRAMHYSLCTPPPRHGTASGLLANSKYMWISKTLRHPSSMKALNSMWTVATIAWS